MPMESTKVTLRFYDYGGNSSLGTDTIYEPGEGRVYLVVSDEGVHSVGSDNGDGFVWKPDESFLAQDNTFVGLRWDKSDNVHIDYTGKASVVDVTDIVMKTSDTNIEFKVLTWVGDRIKEGVTRTFYEAPSMPDPAKYSGITQRIFFYTHDGNGVRKDCVAMRWQYDAEGDEYTLYYDCISDGSIRVATYSCGDGIFAWINNSYRTITFQKQHEYVVEEIPVINYLLENSTDTTLYRSLSILKELDEDLDGDIDDYETVFTKRDFIIDGQSVDVKVTSYGLVYADTGEVIYRYPNYNDELMAGMLVEQNKESTECKVGDIYTISGNTDMYIITGGKHSHYLIESSTLQAIADAIRDKTHRSEPIVVDNFAREIMSIEIITDSQWKEFLGYLEGAEDQYV